MKQGLNRLIRWQIDHPKTVLTFLFLITLIFAGISAGLQFDFTIENLFAQNDPEVDEYFQFREDFGREDNLIYLVYECDDPFSRVNLQRTQNLTAHFQKIEGVDSVLSLTNVQVLSHADLSAETIFSTISEDDDSLIAGKARILNTPLLLQNLISEDAQIAAVILQVSDEYNSHEERERILEEVTDIEQTVPWMWREAGIPVLRTKYVLYMLDDMIGFIAPIILINILVLFLLFRSLRGILLPLVAVLIADIWTMGIMTLLGFQMNIMTYIVPTLVLIVGIADSIHIIVKYQEELAYNEDKATAVEHTIKKIGAAIFLTSFTTAVGFLSLLVTNIAIMREFGLIVAIGVVIAFITSIMFIPSTLILLRRPKQDKIIQLHRTSFRHRLLQRIVNINNTHQFPILTISVGIVLACILFATKVDNDSRLMEDLDPGNELYDDMMYMEDHMGSVLPLEAIVEVRRGDEIAESAMFNPKVMAQVEKLQSFMGTIPEIGKSVSYADYFREMNRSWHDGDSAYYVLPDTRAEIEQILISAGEPDSIFAGLIDTSFENYFSRARISARIQDIDSERAREITDEIQIWAGENLGDSLSVTLTGTTLMALKTNQYLVRNLVYSFMIAFVVIFISMLILFRSTKLALVSMIPNIIPLLLIAGVMGLFHIKLRPTTAMTFAVAFGIAVDDTIHFLARFRQELFASHGKYRLANEKTLFTTGKAIISTSMILISGFLVLVTSNFSPSRDFGLLSAITLLGALLGDLFFLPAVITFVRPRIPFLKHSGEVE